MPASERGRRMQALRERERSHDINFWINSIMTIIGEISQMLYRDNEVYFRYCLRGR